MRGEHDDKARQIKARLINRIFGVQICLYLLAFWSGEDSIVIGENDPDPPIFLALASDNPNSNCGI